MVRLIDSALGTPFPYFSFSSLTQGSCLFLWEVLEGVHVTLSHTRSIAVDSIMIYKRMIHDQRELECVLLSIRSCFHALNRNMIVYPTLSCRLETAFMITSLCNVVCSHLYTMLFLINTSTQFSGCMAPVMISPC